MFQLDDKFLEDVGLAQLPDDQKQAFLQHIYQELEYRVGVRLSDGLSDEQLAEFESFIDRDDEKVQTWVASNAADYVSDPAYTQLKSSVPEGTDAGAILAEFASLKWLGLNRPDYREVVASVLDELKKEIRDNRDAFLGAGTADQSQTPPPSPSQDDYTQAA